MVRLPACPTCGFDPASVSPGDAVVALRSFPRRFRAAAAAPESSPDSGSSDSDASPGAGSPGAGSLGSPGSGGGAAPAASAPGESARRVAAALAEAGEAAGAIAAIGADLRAVLVDDEPTVSTSPNAATDPRASGDAATALDRLTSACEAAAELAASQPAEAWNRTGVRADGPVSAADLLREAVHAGAHHLRATS